MRSTIIWRTAVLTIATGSIGVTHAATNQSTLAANLEHFWSYGRSPPVYPSPQMSGTGGWEESYQYARQFVSQLTNDEKNNLTYGYTSTTNGCSGNIPALERLGFPGMCLQDSGNGVRGTDGVNGYPAGLSIGATWNRDIALRRAQFMGREFKGKGANMVLGPVVAPLGKIAEGGRNWEGFSNDPYLSGELIYQAVHGLQESVIACVKHFIGYEQETNRNPPLLPTPSDQYNVSISSNIDDKTIHELYLWPFQSAVYAGAGSIMCSYNEINGSYACQNSKTLNGLLKQELGFQGFVVTDWGGQHAGLASAEAGLDMTMPSSTYWENGNLTLMISNGSLAQSRLDDMLTRIIASWHRYAAFEEPGSGMPVDLLAPHKLVDVREPAANELLLQAAIEGHVLVKNTNGALPLKKPKLISLFGYDGVAQTQNEPSAGFSKWPFGLLDTQMLGPYQADFNDTYLEELFLSSLPYNSARPGIALNGTLYTGGGSGSTTPAWIDAPYDAFLRKARTDGTLLAWDFYNQEPDVNGASDVCIVFINAQASEGWDRPYIEDSYSDRLVVNVSSQCPNTMVVIHNAGIRTVGNWINSPNITAVIYAHLPGQELGQSLVDIMYGVQSPSGRLPYTVGKKPSDYGSLLSPTVPTANSPLWHPQDNFTEGVYIDYKDFIAKNVTPRFEFGFGLTYSTFNYSDLQTNTVGNVDTAPLSNNTALIEGGVPELWQIVAEVSATVTNTGNVTAAEVAQLYVHIPGGPAKVLRGFEKSFLQPGASCSVKFQLTRKDLSTWDVVSQNWLLQSAAYTVYVGKSVLDVQLEGSISIP